MIELKNEVIQVVKLANEAILQIYNGSDFDVELKSDQSPLTIADKTANKIICDYLEKLTPSYPILSEENKTIPYEVRRHFRRFWMVDPLDGTKEFVKRNGEFTVNIALIEDGKSIMGVVGVPCSGEIYWAIRGEGAYKVEAGKEIRIESNTFTMKDKGLRVVCSRSHLNEETQAFMDRLDEPRAISKGSSLKFLVLAEGGAELYPRLAPTMEWDTAAAQIVLEESGGKVYINGSHTPVTYNKENLLNPHFIAYAACHF